MIERYEDENMALIWNDQARIERWHQIEVAQMRRVSQGVHGDSLADCLAKTGPPNLATVAEFEVNTRHEVFAFLLAQDRRITEVNAHPDGAPRKIGITRALRQWLHYGLTSSDVTDTAQAMAIRDSHRYLAELAGDLRQSLVTLAIKADNIQGVALGRTHGQLAAPMPAGHRWRVLEGMLGRAAWNLSARARVTQIGKLTGPVGVPEEDDWQERLALRELGLERSVPSTQLIPRDLMVKWADSLRLVAQVCEAIATQVWLLAQDGIGEVSERRGQTQIGSSAMPHKSNPVRSENIRGLARLVRMYTGALQDGVVQWGEHDLAHSSVERVVLPDLCHTMATLIKRTSALVGELAFYSVDALDHFADTHQKLRELQESGMPYVEAHARLRDRTYPTGKIDEELEATRTALGPVELREPY